MTDSTLRRNLKVHDRIDGGNVGGLIGLMIVLMRRIEARLGIIGTRFVSCGQSTRHTCSTKGEGAAVDSEGGFGAFAPRFRD
jgi:hypothetical protein